jgi:GH24 family phage-related lysozyme (muramidase)
MSHRECSTAARRTLEVYPRVDQLPPDAQAMVLSLIYNRGARLTGPRRQHMAALKPLIARGDLNAIAGQFELMTQLWPDLPGLCTRRRKEAAMIRGADRRYGEDEIVRV